MSQITAKEGVIDRISQTFKIYFKNIIPLLPVAAIASLLSFWMQIILEQLALNISFSIVVIIITQIILAILWAILWAISTLYFIHAFLKIFKWEKVDIKENISNTMQDIVKYIKAFIEIIIFWFWIPILIMVIWVIGTIIGDTWSVIIGSIGGILIMIGGIWLAILSMQLFPAYFIVFTQNKTWKESVQISKELTEWKWWRTFWNMLLIWLILWVFIFLFSLILIPLITSLWSNILVLNVIPQTLITWIATLFSYLLYKRYKIENEESEDSKDFENFKNSKEFEEFKKSKEKKWDK